MCLARSHNLHVGMTSHLGITNDYTIFNQMIPQAMIIGAQILLLIKQVTDDFNFHFQSYLCIERVWIVAKLSNALCTV